MEAEKTLDAALATDAEYYESRSRHVLSNSMINDFIFLINTQQSALHMLLGLGERGGRDDAAVSRCLLNYGAEVRRRNNTGETPLDRCRGTEVEQVIRDIAAKG